MRPPPTATWQGAALADAITNDATPTAKTTFLQQADYWPVAVAIGPFASCAFMIDNGTSGTPATRYLGEVHPPGCEAARYDASYGKSDYTGAAVDIQASTGYGGEAGNDVAKIQQQAAGTLAFKASTVQQAKIVTSGDWDYSAPAAQADRLLEVETLAYPQFDEFTITGATGVGLWISRQIANLEDL